MIANKIVPYKQQWEKMQPNIDKKGTKVQTNLLRKTQKVQENV